MVGGTSVCNIRMYVMSFLLLCLCVWNNGVTVMDTLSHTFWHLTGSEATFLQPFLDLFWNEGFHPVFLYLEHQYLESDNTVGHAFFITLLLWDSTNKSTSSIIMRERDDLKNTNNKVKNFLHALDQISSSQQNPGWPPTGSLADTYRKELWRLLCSCNIVVCSLWNFYLFMRQPL